MTGNEAVIKFTGNASGQDAYAYHIYRMVDTGANSQLYLPGTVYDVSSDDDDDIIDRFEDAEGDLAEANLFYQRVPLDPPAFDGTKTSADSDTVTFTGEGPSELTLYIWRDSAPSPQQVPTRPSDSEAERLPEVPGTGTMLTIKFLGAPVERDPDDSDVKRSQIGTDGPAATGTDAQRTQATVTVTVQDGMGHPLSGNVTLEVADPDNNAEISLSGGASAIRALRQDDAATGDVNEAGTAVFTITDLPKEGAVKIPVTATVQTPTGPLTLTGNVSRIGVPAMITSMTYLCDSANMVEEDVDATPPVIGFNLCHKEAEQLASKSDTDDPDPRAVFAPGETFLIYSKVVDGLDQEVKQSATSGDDAVDLRASEAPAEGEDKAGFTISSEMGPYAAMDDATTQTVEDNVEAHSAKAAYIMVTVPGKDDVDTGSYNIKVQDTRRNADTTVSVTVSGLPKNYAITGDMWIPLDGEKTYTVTATDENENIPAAGDADYAADGKYGITVRVRGVSLKQDDDVVGLVGSMVDVDADDGMGTFTILAPVGASHGDFATIRVIVNEVVEDTMTVYFGDAPTPQPMLTAPTGVMAMSDAAGMVTVTWTPGTDAIGHLVFLFKSDFSGTPMMGTPSGDSHTFNDVPAGSYIAVVVSYRSASEYMYEVFPSAVAVE